MDAANSANGAPTSSSSSSAGSTATDQLSKTATPIRGKTDPITFLASLNVQLPFVLEVVQEIISLYSLWKSYEDAPALSASPAIGSGKGAGGPGERGPADVGLERQIVSRNVGVGLSNPAAAPGAGDERVIQILARMKMNRDIDLAHPSDAGQSGK